MFRADKLKEDEACPGLSMWDHAKSLATFALRDFEYNKEDLRYATSYFYRLLTKEFNSIEEMANFVSDLDITLDVDIIKGLLDMKHGRFVKI